MTHPEPQNRIRLPTPGTAGEKPRYFTEPFIVEIADIKKVHLGAVAMVVSKAKTPHKDDFPPKLNLVLFTPDRITEELIMNLRSQLQDVNGVEVLQSGGLGGFRNKQYFWIQLEDVGGAELNSIVQAAQQVNPDISFRRPDK